jgi:hypothetical protein
MSSIRFYHAYCSARDQKVRVVRASEVLWGLSAHELPPDPSDVVCIEYGTLCTGSTCPLFQVPSGEMARRLAASGLVGEIEI